MPGRLPTLPDFPSHMTISITPPPSNQPPVNVLILLHGLGDRNASFTNLGKQLALPETACVSIQAPTPLPFDLGGFHWGDDIIFDQATGQMDMDTGFAKAVTTITGVIEALTKRCEYQPHEVTLFSFGQGGMAALAAAVSLKQEFGGIVSIGGPLPASLATKGEQLTVKNRTPVLALGGSSQSLLTSNAVGALKSTFEFVEYLKWQKVGDSMPQSRDEMLPIMHFFSRRLRSRRGVPEGSLEIG